MRSKWEVKKNFGLSGRQDIDHPKVEIRLPALLDVLQERLLFRRSLGQLRKSLVRIGALGHALENVALRRTERMFAEHVLENFGAIDRKLPNTVVVVIPKSKMTLERVALQDPCAKAFFDDGLV